MANQATKEATNNEGIFKQALNTTAERVARTELKVEELRKDASQAIEDGIESAKRIVKRGRHATEDFVDDTAHRIKRDPLRSVGITFGIAFGLGAIVGLLVTRKSKASNDC